jgi:hypothetical protein
MFGVQVFDRESPLTNRRCRDVQFLFPPLRARVSRQTGWRTGLRIDDDSLPQRANASSDGTLPESAAQRYPDAAQTQSPPGISFHLPGAEGWVLSAPPIGSPGFRVSRQDVPGFNVGTQDDAPGLNLDENGLEQQETNWSDGILPGSVTPQDLNVRQTPTPPTGEEAPIPPAPPQLPEWLYKLVTMLPPPLSTASIRPPGLASRSTRSRASAQPRCPAPSSGRPPARLSGRRTSLSAPALPSRRMPIRNRRRRKRCGPLGSSH